MASGALLSILFFTVFTQNTGASHRNALKFETVEGPSTSWLDLYKHISEGRPVKLRNAYLDNKASREWSSEYMYHHPGAALTFRNLTKKNTASIRAIVEQREYFMQMHFRLPLFLRPDAVLPKWLDCDQLIDRMKTPLWLWHFQKTQVRLHSEKVHEIWCIIKGTISLTLLPKWSDGMIDHFLTEKSLTQAPTYKDTEYYQASVKKGECFYVPADSLRQWEPTADSMAIIFQIEKSVLSEREKQFQRCHSVGDRASLEKVRFADDDQQEDGTIAEAKVLQKIISHLDSDDCLDRAQFKAVLQSDSALDLVDGAATWDQTGKDLFEALDTDQDDEFCWSDVDGLTFEGAIQLTGLVNSRLALKSDMDEKTAKSDRKRESDEL